MSLTVTTGDTSPETKALIYIDEKSTNRRKNIFRTAHTLIKKNMGSKTTYTITEGTYTTWWIIAMILIPAILLFSSLGLSCIDENKRVLEKAKLAVDAANEMIGGNDLEGGGTSAFLKYCETMSDNKKNCMKCYNLRNGGVSVKVMLYIIVCVAAVTWLAAVLATGMDVSKTGNIKVCKMNDDVDDDT